MQHKGMSIMETKSIRAMFHNRRSKFYIKRTSGKPPKKRSNYDTKTSYNQKRVSWPAINSIWSNV